MFEVLWKTEVCLKRQQKGLQRYHWLPERVSASSIIQRLLSSEVHTEWTASYNVVFRISRTDLMERTRETREFRKRVYTGDVNMCSTPDSLAHAHNLS